jgi:hypothetical protein
MIKPKKFGAGLLNVVPPKAGTGFHGLIVTDATKEMTNEYNPWPHAGCR